MFCIYLRTNSDLCHSQHILIGFYNRDEKCLLRGTNWVFKLSSLRFVFKGLIDVSYNYHTNTTALIFKHVFISHIGDMFRPTVSAITKRFYKNIQSRPKHVAYMRSELMLGYLCSCIGLLTVECVDIIRAAI